MIILIGSIDLSIGSVLALGAVVGALLQQRMGFMNSGVLGALASAAGAFSVCVLIGSFTGFMVSRFKIPSFVVTLGLLVMARGAALILTDGSRIGPLSDSYRWLGTGFLSKEYSLFLILFLAVSLVAHGVWKGGRGKWLRILTIILISGLSLSVFYGYQGIPVPVLAMAAVFAMTYFLLEKTVFGRYIYAIGGNPEAARLCGIRVPTVVFSIYAIMGLLIGLSAMIESGRIDAGDPNAGNLYELDAIAAVVIGGTSLQGGVGRVTGTILGSILIGTLNNGMSLMNIETNRQMVIKGAIIIFAVWIDVVSKRKGR